MSYTKLYEELGVSPTATEQEIKKAYKKLALVWHPDKWMHGTEYEKKIADAKFKSMGAAYHVLSDKTRKKRYDQYGDEAVDGMSKDEMFDNIFNRMGFPFRHARQTERILKIPDIRTSIDVTMHDIYMGRVTECHIMRYDLLDENNQPTKEDMRCIECAGKGKLIRMIQMEPGMLAQTEEKCATCDDGLIFPDNFFEKKEYVHIITIPRGIYAGKYITIEDQGHEIPECFTEHLTRTRTNIMVSISERPMYEITDRNIMDTVDDMDTLDEDAINPENIYDLKSNGAHDIGINQTTHRVTYQYTRNINDSPANIKVNLDISPHEAICGTYRTIPYINGDMLCIKIPSGAVFKTGARAVILPMFGLPYYEQKNMFGDLYVMLRVVGELSLNDTTISRLWNLLSGTDMEQITDRQIQRADGGYVMSYHLDTYGQSAEYQETEKKRNAYKYEHRSSSHQMDDEDDVMDYDSHTNERTHAGQSVPQCTQQ